MAPAKQDVRVQAGTVSRLGSDFKLAAECLDLSLRPISPDPFRASAPPMPSSSTTTSRLPSKVSAVIGARSLIAAGAVVPRGVVVPPRSLVSGVPGPVRRELGEADLAAYRHNGEVYRRLLDIHWAATQ
jgi:hypothetical protein